MVIAGLFLAGLAYLQYQQIASFDWNRIEGAITTTLGNVTAQILNGQDTAALATSNFGIPLAGSMSAGFAVGFMKGKYKMINIMLYRKQQNNPEFF